MILIARTELWTGFILEPEPGPSPKAQVRTRPDIYFGSPIWAQKPNLPSESRYAQLRGIKKRSVRV